MDVQDLQANREYQPYQKYPLMALDYEDPLATQEFPVNQVIQAVEDLLDYQVKMDNLVAQETPDNQAAQGLPAKMDTLAALAALEVLANQAKMDTQVVQEALVNQVAPVSPAIVVRLHLLHHPVLLHRSHLVQ